MTLWERVEALAKRVTELECSVVSRVGALEAQLPKRPPVVQKMACQLDCEEQGTHRDCDLHMDRPAQVNQIGATETTAMLSGGDYPLHQLRGCFSRLRHEFGYDIGDCERDALIILARARVAPEKP